MNRLQTFIVGVWLGAILCAGAFATDNLVHNIAPFSEYKVIDSYKQKLEIKKAEQDVEIQAIQDLNDEVDSLKFVIKNSRFVTATIYYPTGHEMRSGETIPANYTRTHHNPKFIAISQDLWDRNGGPYSFGDSISVEGTPFDGIYIVEDTMNKRHRKRVDILVSKKNKLNENWANVKICKV